VHGGDGFFHGLVALVAFQHHLITERRPGGLREGQVVIRIGELRVEDPLPTRVVQALTAFSALASRWARSGAELRDWRSPSPWDPPFQNIPDKSIVSQIHFYYFL
jgi:hypothetical protein